MDSFLPTLAICKQCRTRLSGQGEKDDVVLTIPKSQDETQGFERQEESIECPETTSPRAGELEEVSLEYLITARRFPGHLRSVLRGGSWSAESTLD